MNKRILAICDKESRYLYKLQEILERREAFPFEISTYTDGAVLIKEINKVSLILIADEMMQEEFETDLAKVSSNKLVILLDSGMENSGKYPCIWKFQSGEAIRKELLRLYSDYKSDGEEVILSGAINTQGKHDTKLIGIFSPVRRCENTSFSLVLCSVLAKKGPTLYLNLQCFTGIRDLSEEDVKKNMEITDLIYFMGSGVERMIFKLEEMISSANGFDYVKPASSFLDLRSVSKEDWIKLFEIIRAYGSYEYLVIELSEIDDGLLDILRICNQIITNTSADKCEQLKINEYNYFLREQGYEDVLNRIRYMELPVVSNNIAVSYEYKNAELQEFTEKELKGGRLFGL